MRASGSRRRSLLLVGLLIAVCCAQYAAAARSSSSNSRTLKQVDIAGKNGKKPKPLSQSDIMSLAAATGAMLPACVPKYVSELVIPPPMPVTTQPLTEVSICAGFMFLLWYLCVHSTQLCVVGRWVFQWGLATPR